MECSSLGVELVAKNTCPCILEQVYIHYPMTESSWGTDQYVPRFDYGEPDYADAICVRSHEQQFSAENYGISGYRCGGKAPAWYTPPESSYNCRGPADKCRKEPSRRGPPGEMAGGPEGTRSGGWMRDPLPINLPVQREKFDGGAAMTSVAQDCVQIVVPKQWLFVILFVLLMTLSVSVGMCYKFMRKLSKHMKSMKSTQ